MTDRTAQIEQADRFQVEITRYMDRAQTLQDRNGGFMIEQCLTADDLATLERAAGIFSFVATQWQTWGMDPTDVDALVNAGSVCLKAAREFTDPEQNWKE